MATRKYSLRFFIKFAAMNKRAAWRQTLYRIIFEADTPAGKRFDIALLVLIVLSIALVMIESVPRIHARYGFELEAGEWFITLTTVGYGDIVPLTDLGKFIASFIMKPIFAASAAKN